MSKLHCRRCLRTTPHQHFHEEAHGISGTHMEGSEHFSCTECRTTTHAADNVHGMPFRFDVDRTFA